MEGSAKCRTCSGTWHTNNPCQTFIVICLTFGVCDIFFKFVAQINEFPDAYPNSNEEWRLFNFRQHYSRNGLLKILSKNTDDTHLRNLVRLDADKPPAKLFQRDLDSYSVRKSRHINREDRYIDEPRQTDTPRMKRETKPAEHISFLKVHLAGSNPLQLILFRYGFERNLSFVLPSKGHYFTKSTRYPEPILPPRYGTHYDIVCNHACFNYSLYSSLMPDDSVYIAIVRDPYTQFLNSYFYYLKFLSFGYLKKIPDPAIENLIKYPDKYDEGRLSYTMNAMARDFGFQTNHYHDFSPGAGISSATIYLENIAKVFDLVLVYERYEESLVLLKRRLRWPLKAILFMPEQENNPEMRIGGTLLQTFKQRNKLDYLVYDYFKRRLDEKIREAGADLVEETINFKLTLKTVRLWCDYRYFGKLILPATRWNEKFEITSLDCELMGKSEFEFMDLLKGTTDS